MSTVSSLCWEEMFNFFLWPQRDGVELRTDSLGFGLQVTRWDDGSPPTGTTPPIIMIISCKIMGPLWTKYFPTNHVLSFVKSLKKYSTNPPRPRKMSHLLLVTKLNERLNGQLFSLRIVYRCFHLELSQCEFTIKCASCFSFETNVWLQLWFSRAPFRMVVLHKSLTAAADRAIKRFRLIFGRKRIGLTCVCVEQW